MDRRDGAVLRLAGVIVAWSTVTGWQTGCPETEKLAVGTDCSGDKGGGGGGGSATITM